MGLTKIVFFTLALVTVIKSSFAHPKTGEEESPVDCSEWWGGYIYGVDFLPLENATGTSNTYSCNEATEHDLSGSFQKDSGTEYQLSSYFWLQQNDGCPQVNWRCVYYTFNPATYFWDAEVSSQNVVYRSNGAGGYSNCGTPIDSTAADFAWICSCLDNGGRPVGSAKIVRATTNYKGA